MRITGGIHRSRTLFTPKDNAVRPTSDKIRQAVFNMLNARGLVQNAVVIDAFCGTGALGLEALSQGASYCTFFDKSKNSIALTKQNIQNLKENEHSAVFLSDVTKVKLRSEDTKLATLVFMDPPYHKNLVIETIQDLKNKDWFSGDAHLLIETAKDEIINCPLINMISEKFYGDTKIILAELK